MVQTIILWHFQMYDELLPLRDTFVFFCANNFNNGHEIYNEHMTTLSYLKNTTMYDQLKIFFN